MSNSDGRARKDRLFVRIHIFAILNWRCCRGNQSAVSQSGPHLFVGAQCAKCQKAAASAIVPQRFRDGFACSGLTDWRHKQLLKAHINGGQPGNLVLSVWEEPIHRHDRVQMDHRYSEAEKEMEAGGPTINGISSGDDVHSQCNGRMRMASVGAKWLSRDRRWRAIRESDVAIGNKCFSSADCAGLRLAQSWHLATDLGFMLGLCDLPLVKIVVGFRSYFECFLSLHLPMTPRVLSFLG
jgi:hypothetical protein